MVPARLSLHPSAGSFVAMLLISIPAASQTPIGRAATAQASQPQAPTSSGTAAAQVDALGRETPRGTVSGFMAALRRGNDEVGVLYLNTNKRDNAARELAHQLYVVLDSRLPARLPDLTDRPEGSLANPFKPNQDVVATIETANGPLDLIVEQVNQNGLTVWLFSRATLEAIPNVFREIDLVSVDRHLPGFLLRPQLAGVRLFEWLVILIAIPICYRIIGAGDQLLARLIAAIRRRKTPSSRLDAGVIPKGLRLILLAVAIRWLLASLDLPLIERQFWQAASALLATAGVAWLLLSLNATGERYIQRRFIGSTMGEVTALLRVARRLVDVFIVSAGVLAGLAYFDVDPTAALAGLGIGGIAVALAAQKTLENVIGGLSIVLDKAVRVGDFIKVGDIQGTVDGIGLRSTRIRTPDRTVLRVPNGQIANINIETLSMRDMFWFHHFVPLRYETTAAQMRTVIDGLRHLLEQHPAVDRGVIRVRLIRLGPFSLDIELSAYVRAADMERFLGIQQELLLMTMEIVEAAGTRVALPSQELRFANAPAWALPSDNSERPPAT